MPSRDIEGPPCVAVVGQVAADHDPTFRLTVGEMEGTGSLQRGFHGFGATRDRVDGGVIHGQPFSEGPGIALADLRSEGRGMHI